MNGKTAEWWREYLNAGDIMEVMERQIEEYLNK